jgi:hypothetical protein
MGQQARVFKITEGGEEFNEESRNALGVVNPVF